MSPWGRPVWLYLFQEQKARFRWSLEGDENSKFFHSTIRRRYSKTIIRGLNINGVWTENPEEVKRAVLGHFETIFNGADRSRPQLAGWSKSAATSVSLGTRLTNTEAVALELPFSEAEIWDAVRECGSTKAPGPDEFNMRFYKKNWNVIRDDLVGAIILFGKKVKFPQDVTLLLLP
ncbi:uncharacterized protein [Rutidosis leptorrhynchoides]|uniref:uncharacterized protein n=1 Tax=Rutidosis leptorrhynchoides TaxID=125765 RepID=UPI003A99FE2A